MENHYLHSKGLHINYSFISDIIDNNSKVLDLGCGDGYLLRLLKDKKNIKGIGIEISQEQVIKCIENGMSVIQGNIDDGLRQFKDKSYDYVILNQTLQTTKNPDYVLEEMLRVGKRCIVSFPNFGYWRIRFSLFFKGKMPKSKVLPFEWFDTPNIHLLTVKDFFEFVRKRNIFIEKSIYTTRDDIKDSVQQVIMPNFFAQEALFLISKK